jgi:hypothetical protein
MGTMDTQVRTAQAILSRWMRETFSLALEVDEKVWPNERKTLEGVVNGTPFQVRYTPRVDIKGDTSVDVQYGLMAGLDPNRWLVFGLQARAEKLISRDYLRRQMPADLDAGDEERKVDIEDYREALKQALAGYAQAIPVLAQQGQDPREILEVLTTIIADRQKGTPIEESIAHAFQPASPESSPSNSSSVRPKARASAPTVVARVILSAPLSILLILTREMPASLPSFSCEMGMDSRKARSRFRRASRVASIVVGSVMGEQGSAAL